LKLGFSVLFLRRIEKQVRDFTVPSVTRISSRRNPYQVLISCILSLRTKDQTTLDAAKRLFKIAPSCPDMVKLNKSRIERLIYPVGFYRTKAAVILDASRRILKDFSGRVPNNRDLLLGFKGVGRKTANLVLGLGYNIPAICVDTHVHRISNRLGWVNTRIPEETEAALVRIIPRREWIALNTTLVAFGQNICLPVSPFCSRCRISRFCVKKGIKRSR
jgi:endonuclease-3